MYPITLDFILVAATILALAFVMITPTKWGIWSYYYVGPDAAGRGTVLVQHFHFYGFRWNQLYLKNKGTWYRVKPDGTASTNLGAHNTAWLDGKVAEWQVAARYSEG